MINQLQEKLDRKAKEDSEKKRPSVEAMLSKAHHIFSSHRFPDADKDVFLSRNKVIPHAVKQLGIEKLDSNSVGLMIRIIEELIIKSEYIDAKSEREGRLIDLVANFDYLLEHRQ